MLKSVLESVSEMLSLGLESGVEVNASKAYITSAKTLLDKTISGMEATPVVVDAPRTAASQHPFAEVLATKSLDGVVVDAPNGKLERVSYADGQEVPGTTVIELDGKQMLYRDAVGKTFKTGRVVGA